MSLGRGNFRMKPIDEERLTWWVNSMVQHAYDRSNGARLPFDISASSGDGRKLYSSLIDRQVDTDGAIAVHVNRSTDGTDPTGDLVTMTLGSFLWLVENFVSANQVATYLDREEFTGDLREKNGL